MTSDTNLTKLLPVFRQCDQYADRLTFWQEHGLTEILSYTTREFDNDTDAGKAGIEYSWVLQAEIKAWDDLKQWPVLTLTPFTRDDARLFVDWALRIRPVMSDAPQTAEVQISQFRQEYAEQDFKHLRDELVSSYRQRSLLWLNGRLHESYAVSKNALGLCLTDSDSKSHELFEQFMHNQARKIPIDLASEMSVKDVNMSWKDVDTYLFAKAKYDFAVYLEQFDPANIAPATVSAMASDEPDLDQRHRILIHFYEDGKMPERKHKDYNKYITFSSSRKRLAYPGESQSKLKHLITDIDEVRDLLSDKAKQQADLELNTLRLRLTVEK